MTSPFSPSDTRKFVPVAGKTISLARLLGWDVRWMGVKQDAVTLRSPDGNKTINIPTTNVNANRAKSWARAIFRYTDDAHLARFVNGELDLMKEDEQTQSLVATFGSEVITMLREKAAASEPVRDRAMTVTNSTPGAKPAPLPVKADIPAVDSVMQNAVETKPAKGGRYIVKVEPYMRKDHSRKKDAEGNILMFPSEHINVVTYSDGTIEYGCTQCDYTTPKGWQSVLIHRHSHTDAINRKIQTRLEKHPPKGRTRDRKPEDRMDEATHLDDVVPPSTALTQGTPWTRDPEVRAVPVIEPSSMDDMLLTIRRFIQTEFDRRFEALTTERDELREKYMAAAVEADRLRENLKALKGLMNDI